MLQLVRQPSSGTSQSIAWSKSPSILSFIKKGIYTTRGRHAKLFLVVDSASLPTPGQQLKLTWIDTSLTFTFGGANPDDPLYLTPWVSGWQFAADLNRNTTFSQYYTATCISTAGGGAKLLIEAINNGTDYNLSETGSTMTFGAGTAITAGVDDVLNEDYALLMNAELVTNIHTEPRTSGVLALQASGVLDEKNDQMKLDFFDLHEIARGIIESSLPDNPWDIFLQDRTAAVATIELIEFYAGQQWKGKIDIYGDIKEYATAIFINGGVSLPDMPGDINDLSISGLMSFLTSQNREKVVSPDQPEWLSILMPPCNMQVVYTIYYSDGSISTTTTSYSLSYFPGVVTIPCGWDQCGFGAPFKQATYYTVQVMIVLFSTVPYSEIFTFILDRRYFRDVRYFLMENSQGGWDTMRTVGVTKLSAKYTVNSSRRALNVDSTAMRGTIEMVINEEDQTETIRSGWLQDRDEAEYYRQLFLSTRIVEIIMPLVPKLSGVARQQGFTAYVLEQNSIDIYETSASRWGIEAKIARAHRETNYTKIRSAAAPEVIYDSVIEFIVSGSGSITLTDGGTYDAIRYTINGSVVVPVAGVITLSGADSYYIKAEAQNLTAMAIVCSTAGTTLTVARIKTATMLYVLFNDFDTVKADYLIDRVKTLYALIAFEIHTTDVNFRVDDLLMAFIQKSNLTSVIPAFIDFSNSTPTAVGYAAKTQLITAGSSVSTL